MTRNEERNLPIALASVPSGCRILVVDSYSTDRTLEIARDAGAHIVTRDWRGFIDARLFALSMVDTEWTLMLDADEEIGPELRQAIVNADGKADAYRFSRTTFFAHRPMRIWRDERIVRLFRTAKASLRSRARNEKAQVHEVWSVAGTVEDLDGVLLHHSYPTIASYREKFDGYTALEARGIRASVLQVRLARLGQFARFLFLLFGRGSIADGWRGVYVAWWSAAYPVEVLKKALAP